MGRAAAGRRVRSRGLSALSATVFRRLTDTFAAHADPGRAVEMAAYMRDQFPFFGIPTPARRALGREVLAGLPVPTERELGLVARKCWAQSEREYQYFACDYVRRYVKSCSAEFLDTIDWLVTHKSWWDTVDALAQSVGVLVPANPGLRADMDRWVEDPNFWRARVALIHQLASKQHTDTERLFGYCAARARDDEFFIRKAVGWALREYAKTDPAAVRAFVAAHPELSALSKREALRRLS